MASGIYAILNVENGMRYVGSSAHIWERVEHHYHMLEDDKHANRKLQEAYWLAPDKFTLVILEWCLPQELTKTEQKWIDRGRRMHRLYNIRMVAERPEDKYV